MWESCKYGSVRGRARQFASLPRPDFLQSIAASAHDRFLALSAGNPRCIYELNLRPLTEQYRHRCGLLQVVRIRRSRIFVPDLSLYPTSVRSIGHLLGDNPKHLQ
jgi:hypothetical protein